LAGGGVPWIAYLPANIPLVWNRRNTRQPADDARLFVWIWLVGSILFLTMARSKLLTYMLPVFPAIALLAAETWDRFLEKDLPELGRRALVAVFWVTSLAGPLVMPVALAIVGDQLKFNITPFQWGGAVAISAFGWLPIVLWKRGWIRTTLV